MIDNFAEVKKQLLELSEVVNKFKSEAVQLRIVDLVLGSPSNEAASSERRTGSEKTQASTKPRPKKKPKSQNKEKAPKKSRASGMGAVAALSDLVDGDFFDKPKTINDIVTHCDEKLARRFKSNEFSGKLGRLTRDGVLDRKKNSDGQYEYVKR